MAQKEHEEEARLGHECEEIILQQLQAEDEFETAERRPFTIRETQGGKAHLETSIGGDYWFHIEHAGLCLHWMRVEGKTIEGVGSKTKNSVRWLVGANGLLAACSKCDRNPANIWGILRALPAVQEGEENELFMP